MHMLSIYFMVKLYYKCMLSKLLQEELCYYSNFLPLIAIRHFMSLDARLAQWPYAEVLFHVP